MKLIFIMILSKVQVMCPLGTGEILSLKHQQIFQKVVIIMID